MDENQTRNSLIDQKLQKAGWDTNNHNQVKKEFSISKKSTTLYADYALLDTDGTVLAVVEAKNFSKSARDGYYQAIQYSSLIGENQTFQPFIFLSNGKEIQFCDLDTPPRKVDTFFSKKDLKRIYELRKIQKPAQDQKVDNDIAGRSYQIHAIKSVTEGIDNGQRSFLLTMATGTGKTRTAMGLIDVLMKTHHVQRVLFLCDRENLRDQAYNDGFKQHFPDEPKTKIKTGETNENARLFAATYQTMINYLDDFTSGFFDLIIVDEVHRSIYGQWKAILDHFDAYKVGLTATPVEYVERNTYQAFGCREQDPTFSYPLDQAIKDGYLVPYHVLMARTRFQIQGIKGRQLPGHLKEQLEKEGKSPEEYNFEGEDKNEKNKKDNKVNKPDTSKDKFNKPKDKQDFENKQSNNYCKPVNKGGFYFPKTKSGKTSFNRIVESMKGGKKIVKTKYLCDNNGKRINFNKNITIKCDSGYYSIGKICKKK